MPKSGSLLIIDDNRQVLQSLKFLLGFHFENIGTATNPNVLPSLIGKGKFDVYLLDMNFRAGINSGNEGLFWLNEVITADPAAVVVMITAFGDVNLAVRAMKSGASDFVLKPWDNDQLTEVMQSALKLRRLKEKLASDTWRKDEQNDAPVAEVAVTTLPGKSERMNRLWSDIAKVAPTDANILLLGENGTGKEVIAREIHKLSNRKNRVFLNVDLGAVPGSLMESELFGHVKGAYTDAHEDKAGKFEAANGGSLFLDEIGNLDIS
ncbi:MAG TPA: sigma 54-interacting transcriptional regulator, partial [Bacteroidales bacterium]|nr:sigma 54-interacting transcriptional regulator [Bacteroidales bacterium]